MVAQGNALGAEKQGDNSPERAAQWIGDTGCFAPPGLCILFCRLEPRAVPWATMFRPFQGNGGRKGPAR